MTGLDATLIVELLALGALVGFLAGLLGIGGGMMLVPSMTYLVSARGVEPGLAVKMAIATSMATIMFTSIASLRAHHRHGAVRWDLLKTLAPGIIAGGLAAGAGLFALLEGQALAVLFAVFIGWSALQMLRGRQPKPGRQLPGPAGQFVVGSGIGLVSGLLGAGGAFMSVPFMVRCNVPLRAAVGTSAAIGLPIALASTTGVVFSGWSLAPALPGAFGYLWLPALAVVSLASMLLAPLGARVAHRTDVNRLRQLFALLLLALAGYMLGQAYG